MSDFGLSSVNGVSWWSDAITSAAVPAAPASTTRLATSARRRVVGLHCMAMLLLSRGDGTRAGSTPVPVTRLTRAAADRMYAMVPPGRVTSGGRRDGVDAEGGREPGIGSP